MEATLQHSVLCCYWILSSFLCLFSLSTVSFFFLLSLLPWWKLREASPSATVFIYTRLCPLLKVFLCCSTLWALSCLVSLLVTLLALTDSQVKCILRAACVCVLVTFVPPLPPPHYLSCSTSFCVCCVHSVCSRGLWFNLRLSCEFECSL